MEHISKQELHELKIHSGGIGSVNIEEMIPCEMECRLRRL